MNRVCKPYLDKFVIVFIDDILIYSKYKEKHEVYLKLVLELLKKEKLFDKFSKCEFWLQEVHFLEHVVNSDGIHVDPSKIEAVKNCKYEWGKEQEEVFQTLKDNLCNAPILSLPDGPKSFVVYCDAVESSIRSWIELFSDYECEIRYHPGKANVVVDALSRKERVKPKRVREIAMTIQSGVKIMILAAQSEAFKEENAPAERLQGLDQQMERKEDEILYFMDRIWVLLVGGVRTIIMDEAHKTRYYVHLGEDNMYHDLRDMYWWPGMKRDIATLPRSSSGYDTNWVTVDRLTKSAHFLAILEDYKMEKLARRLYRLGVSLRHGVPCQSSQIMMEDLLQDFGRPLYGRKCRSPVLWAEIKESRLIGPKLVQKTTDKVVLIKEKLKAARDRQKSYADNRRKLLEFEVEDQVLLKVSPWKGVVRLERKTSDANLHVHLEEIKVDKTLCFIEEPVEIIDREVNSLKRSKIPIVKVRWNSKRGSEFTWEREDHMKAKYPRLFVDCADEYAYSVGFGILIWDQMSMPTQWDRMGTSTQCDMQIRWVRLPNVNMLFDIFWVSLIAYSASYSKPECEFLYVKYVDWIMLHASIGEHLEESEVRKLR
ncbi:putative reverse transcriptase domain-containing protein [Tanacetum coccineum]